MKNMDNITPRLRSLIVQVDLARALLKSLEEDLLEEKLRISSAIVNGNKGRRYEKSR